MDPEAGVPPTLLPAFLLSGHSTHKLQQPESWNQWDKFRENLWIGDGYVEAGKTKFKGAEEHVLSYGIRQSVINYSNLQFFQIWPQVNY